MGTRSLTHVKEEGQTICTVYRQFDGYLDGHGQEIAAFLAPKKLVNGFNDPETQINGMGDLAAQLIAYLKTRGIGPIGAGGVYVMPPDTIDVGEEYTYTIEEDRNGILITVFQPGETAPLFKGTPKELLAKLEGEK